MGDRKLCVAAFSIFLLLSACPVNASRIQVVSEEPEVPPELPADSRQCHQLQQTFVQRTNELDFKVTQLQEGTLRGRGQLGMVIKMRRMAGVMRRAANLNCEWVTGSNHDDAQILQSIAARTMHANPCREAAADALRQAQEEPEENQGPLVMGAMQMLMSGTCNGEEEEEDIGEESEVLALPKDATIESPEVLNQISKESDQLEDEADNMIDELVETQLDDDAALLQMEGPNRGGGLGEHLARFVANFVAMLLFALVCTVVLGVILLIITLIICTIVGLFGLLFGRTRAGGNCVRGMTRNSHRIPFWCAINSLLQSLGFHPGTAGAVAHVATTGGTIVATGGTIAVELDQ